MPRHTHPKRRRPRHATRGQVENPRPKSTSSLARRLVRLGLASTNILESHERYW